ncbi:MAG: hypothetical protein B7X46_13680 [Thiomonas sp. 15-66-11]|nr:MAG: hypothetical protein B7X46_13680 [Thiomonas sp. 15-66-11]
MPHRRAAFYRLFCTDFTGMQRMWDWVDQSIPAGDRKAFLSTLIDATDSVLDLFEDDPAASKRPSYPQPKQSPAQPLREPHRAAAHKLARQLQRLRLVTPQRCAAFHADVIRTGVHIERLAIDFDLDLPPLDLNAEYRKAGIEWAAETKRGWMQRRRASDTSRIQAMKTLRRLVQLAPEHQTWLERIASELESLPDADVEHAGEPEWQSQKASWLDWVRVVDFDLYGIDARRHYNLEPDYLRLVDWATLAEALLPDVSADPVLIGRVLRAQRTGR